jgi:hypothetical protein
MEMYILEIGWMIRLMAMESIFIQMVQRTKETGKKINKMVME